MKKSKKAKNRKLRHSFQARKGCKTIPRNENIQNSRRKKKRGEKLSKYV
jgi:hypothetical protein